MSHKELSKQLFDLAKKITKETDLGFKLQAILERKFPLEKWEKEQQRLEKELSALARIFYVNKIYSDSGEKHPGFILTEMEICLIKIEKMAKEINLEFKVVEKIFKEHGNKEGFLQSSNIYGGRWNWFKEDLELKDFYKLTSRAYPD